MNIDELKSQLRDIIPGLDPIKFHFLTTVGPKTELLGNYSFQNGLDEKTEADIDNKYGLAHNLIAIWPHPRKPILIVEINWGKWFGQCQWHNYELSGSLSDRTKPRTPLTDQEKLAFKEAIFGHFENQKKQR